MASEDLVITLIDVNADSTVAAETLVALAREVTFTVRAGSVLGTIVFAFTALVNIAAKFPVAAEALVTLACVVTNGVRAHRILVALVNVLLAFVNFNAGLRAVTSEA